MENIVFISMGSNIEDREEHLSIGISELKKDERVTIQSISSIYETEPVGYTEQENFLNLVVKLMTTYTPDELLQVTQEIEKKAKKNTLIRWGPRTLDLDILLYNQENIEMSNLQIPHPRMLERAFVIVPLLEIDPSLMLPRQKETLQQINERLTDKEGVKLWKKQIGELEYGHFGS